MKVKCCPHRCHHDSYYKFKIVTLCNLKNPAKLRGRVKRLGKFDPFYLILVEVPTYQILVS